MFGLLHNLSLSYLNQAVYFWSCCNYFTVVHYTALKTVILVCKYVLSINQAVVILEKVQCQPERIIFIQFLICVALFTVSLLLGQKTASSQSVSSLQIMGNYVNHKEILTNQLGNTYFYLVSGWFHSLVNHCFVSLGIDFPGAAISLK